MNRFSLTTRLFAVTTVLITKYYSGDQIENNGIDRACSRYGERRRYTGSWWENLREEDHWGDPGIDGRVILK